jgi:hypothetical protein
LGGSPGVIAEHEPSHTTVPVLVCPQEFGKELQLFPYPFGFCGIMAEHEPSQVTVPVLI